MSSKIIAGTTSGTALNMSADTSGQLEIQTGSGPTTAITVTSGQNVGIGTTTPVNYGAAYPNLTINGSTTGVLDIQANGTTQLELSSGTNIASIAAPQASGVLAFSAGGNTERMRIAANGYVSIATTNAGSVFNVSGNGAAISHIGFYDTNTGGRNWVMGPGTGNGNAANFGIYNITNTSLISTATSTGAWYQGNNSSAWSVVSDERIKENISTLNNGLSVVTSLRPVEFDYKISKKHDIGFIAQEYQKVLPEQINENEPTSETKEFIKDNKLLGITSNLVPYLVSAIQELNAKVTALEAQLGAK